MTFDGSCGRRSDVDSSGRLAHGPSAGSAWFAAHALALRRVACLARHRVAFRTAAEWVDSWPTPNAQGAGTPSSTSCNASPAVVDEVPFDPHAANLVFMLVSCRYGRASPIVTSNKPLWARGEIFDDDVAAAAVIDPHRPPPPQSSG